MIYNSTATSVPVLYFFLFFFFVKNNSMPHRSHLELNAALFEDVETLRLELFRPINDSRSTGTGIAVARDKARKRLREA